MNINIVVENEELHRFLSVAGRNLDGIDNDNETAMAAKLIESLQTTVYGNTREFIRMVVRQSVNKPLYTEGE